MAGVKWIKLSTDIFDNRKIRQIEKMPEGDAIVIIWLKLLILAASVNDGGSVYFTRDIPYTEQLLANEFDRPLATVQLALRTFEMFEMIDICEEIIHVTNWERYQNLEGLEKIREQTRNRVASYRERKRLPSNVTSNVTVTQCNATDIDIEIDKELDKSVNKTRKKFVPPTLEEVEAYCASRQNSVDPQRFVDYYTARGWELKPGQKVKDWQACVRTWERNNPKEKTANRPVATDADLERMLGYLG